MFDFYTELESTHCQNVCSELLRAVRPGRDRGPGLFSRVSQLLQRSRLRVRRGREDGRADGGAYARADSVPTLQDESRL